jgi:hypothetical protein
LDQPSTISFRNQEKLASLIPFSALGAGLACRETASVFRLSQRSSSCYSGLPDLPKSSPSNEIMLRSWKGN